jgi:hypothetical protein
MSNFNDFLGMQAAKLNMTREEYTAYYLSESKPGPKPYHRGLDDDEIEDKKDQIKKQSDMDDNDSSAYKEMPGDKEAREKGEVKTSKHVKKYHELYGDKKDESVDEATFRPNSGTMSGGTYTLDNRKYKLKKDIEGVQIGNYTNIVLPKGTIIHNIPGGVFADHPSLKRYENGNNKYFNKPTFKGISIIRKEETIFSIDKNSKILESVVTEAKAYKLKASEFGGDTHSAAYNVKGETTWRVHSTYAIDQVSGENNPEERDVVFFEAMPINNDIYIKIGGINNLKRTNGATVGNNFGTTIEEWKKDPKGIAKEASKFLTDATHLKWINKKARSEGQVIKWALKDDYSSVIEDLVNKSLGLKESVSAAYNNLEKIFGTDQESMDMFQGIEDKGTVKDMIAFIDEFGNEEMLSRYGIKSTSQVKKLAEFIMGESVTEGEDTIGGLNKMANTDLERIADYADMIKDRMSQGQTLDAWMYSKISDSVKNLNSVHDTMDGNDGVNEAKDSFYIKQLTDTFDKFKLPRKYEIMMDSLFGGGSKIAVLRKRNTYGGGAMIDTHRKDGGSNYEGFIEILSSRSGRPIPGKSKFDNIDDAMKAATKFVDGIKESVNEAKFTKRSLMKAMKKDDGMIQLGNGQEYVIYAFDNGNDDNDDMWGDKTIFALDQDGGEHEIKYSDIVRYDESVVTEAMDINDPVLVAYRRTRAIMELPKFKSAEVKSRRISFNKYMDLLDSQSDITIDIANYVEIMAQTLRDMEQEAEPEGGAIADKYGSIMMKQEKEYTKLKAKKAKIDARIEKYKMS